jgi:small subunit ribosomal protein S8
MNTDPIADFLTRIRNAHVARHRTVVAPASKIKIAVARILEQEGYIEGYEVLEKGPKKQLRIALKYGPSGERAITGLERVSRPGRRVYCSKSEIPKVLGGLGIAILSTPRGVLSGSAAKRLGVGGEVLCNVW